MADLKKEELPGIVAKLKFDLLAVSNQVKLVDDPMSENDMTKIISLTK